MKNLFLFATLAICGALGAQHEIDENDKRTPEEKAAALTKKMTKELNLSPEQAAKIEPKNLEFFKEQSVHHEKMKALREEHKKMLDKHRANIKADLTPDQQKKAEEIMEQRKEKRKEKIKKRRGR